VRIRPASLADAESILRIYSPNVTDSHVSFEYEVPSWDTMQNRIKTIQERFPFLVLEDEQGILGYAYATTFRARQAYDFSAETSIYLHPNCQGKGYGKMLYKALFDALKTQGISKLFAVISLPNESSIAFHKSLGFEEFGRTPNVGFKMNTWWGLAWLMADLDAEKSKNG